MFTGGLNYDCKIPPQPTKENVITALPISKFPSRSNNP